MNLRNFMALFAITLLLAACNTTVITDEDRELPEPTAPAEDTMPTDDIPQNDSEKLENMADREDMNEEEMDDDDHEDMEDDNNDTLEANDEEEEESAGPTTQEADLSQSFIAFTGAKGDITSHEGKFNNFSLKLTRENGAPVSMTAIVHIDSIETDSDGLTNHLKAPDFFDVNTHPVATFESTSFDGATVTGNLNIKGTTRTLSFPIDLTDTYLVASFEIDRTEFNVGPAAEGVKAIDATVPMELKIVFK